jgi:hypothetical protein
MKKLWSIDGFDSLSKQEIFDKSVSHVLKNGQPSMNDDSIDIQCQFGGIGCGTAPFLKPSCRRFADNYSSKEGWSVSASWDSLATDGKVSDHFVGLVTKLQQAHDEASKSSDFLDAYRYEAEQVARIFSLSTAVITAHFSASAQRLNRTGRTGRDPS